MDESLIPGTQRLELGNRGAVLLCPTPSNDPNDPLNWSTTRKSIHVALLSLYTILVFGTLCVGTPIWNDLNVELGISFDNLNYGYAACQGAMALGCIVCVPLAQRYGRRPVYIVTSLVMIASAVWLARMKTSGDYFGASVLYGLAGCVNEALFQITIADLFFVHQRGTLTGIYVANLIIGNYLSPVAGGYIGQNQGWRWTYWWCTILLSIMTVLLILFLEESKVDISRVHGQSLDDVSDVQHSKEEKATPVNTNSALEPAPEALAHSTVAYTRDSRREDRLDPSIPTHSYRKRYAMITRAEGREPLSIFLTRRITRPLLLVVQLPAVLFTSVQYGWTMTLLVVCATTQATILPYPPYSFSSIGVGNMSLPPAIGAILGSVFGGPVVDFMIVQVSRRRNGIYEPETRLWLYLVPGFTGAAGMWMYGLTIAKGMPWIINAVGAGLMGFAIGGCSDMAVTYMQDSYQGVLGDALVASVFIRNSLATGLIFAVPAWQATDGTYNMFVILGVLTLVIFSACLPMIIWGRSFRGRTAAKYTMYAAEHI
ncbi:hypothetical protein LTR10_020755 [Elasticomyces elasticus]|nr:hypothetical protein LTR10_020755 [Elasticomyces elasticus]KAK5181662.1 hypothetical protein LTR44_005861 [Eurotiomycetes sp. CCFEE 6388]